MGLRAFGATGDLRLSMFWSLGQTGLRTVGTKGPFEPREHMTYIRFRTFGVLCTFTMPYYFTLCHTMPYYSIPCHTIPYYAKLFHTIPYCAILFHTIPYYAILCHTMPYYAILCHTMPYYSILFHTIPYYSINGDTRMETSEVRRPQK